MWKDERHGNMCFEKSLLLKVLKKGIPCHAESCGEALPAVRRQKVGQPPLWVSLGEVGKAVYV
jgi:hypothetical protein